MKQSLFVVVSAVRCGVTLTAHWGSSAARAMSAPALPAPACGTACCSAG